MSDTESDFGITESQKLCEAKADAFLARVGDVITPRDMYILGCVGGYHGVTEVGGFMEWPDGFIFLLDEICDAFRMFSDWGFVRTPGVPRNDSDLAQKEDEWVPYRNILLQQLNDRICQYAVDNGDVILRFYKERSMRRWKRVVRYAKLRSIVMYWVHTANKPQSAGFYSGMRGVCT